MNEARTSYVDQGTGCWRLYWTYEHPDGDDQALVTVLQIGPHR
ncbi:hypothetical protein [Streptomyces tateyamensis]|nr:hypothetical protein [Streptomyces tateyamensis]